MVKRSSEFSPKFLKPNPKKIVVSFQMCVVCFVGGGGLLFLGGKTDHTGVFCLSNKRKKIFSTFGGKWFIPYFFKTPPFPPLFFGVIGLEKKPDNFKTPEKGFGNEKVPNQINAPGKIFCREGGGFSPWGGKGFDPQ